MKYYLIHRYNSEGKYCSHGYYELPENENIKEFVNKFDTVHEVTQSEFEKHPFYTNYWSERYIHNPKLDELRPVAKR